MHVAIICGYGLWDASVRTPTEIAGLEEFYTACFAHIEAEDVKAIVLCGGYTNPQKPELSEAQSVYDEIQRRKLNRMGVPMYMEDRSSNTVQSIVFSWLVLREHAIYPNDIIVYCDTPRRLKTAVIVGRFFEDWPPFRVVGMPRRDIHPNSKAWKQNIQALRFFFSQKLFLQQLDSPNAAQPQIPPST